MRLRSRLMMRLQAFRQVKVLVLVSALLRWAFVLIRVRVPVGRRPVLLLVRPLVAVAGPALVGVLLTAAGTFSSVHALVLARGREGYNFGACVLRKLRTYP